MSKRKSTGHVCFWDTREVVEIGDLLWISDLSNTEFDPDGYRLGLTRQGTQGVTKEEWLRDCQRLIDSAVDGKYYDMCVHPENADVFRRPNPDPQFLHFYRLCQSAYEVCPEVRDNDVRAWAYTPKIASMRRILSPIAITVNEYFAGKFSELKFPLHQLHDAIRIVEAERACGR